MIPGLLPRPGGFEGFGLRSEAENPRQLSASHEECGVVRRMDLDAAATASCVEHSGNEDLVAEVAELLDLQVEDLQTSASRK